MPISEYNQGQAFGAAFAPTWRGSGQIARDGHAGRAGHQHHSEDRPKRPGAAVGPRAPSATPARRRPLPGAIDSANRQQMRSAQSNSSTRPRRRRHLSSGLGLAGRLADPLAGPGVGSRAMVAKSVEVRVGFRTFKEGVGQSRAWWSLPEICVSGVQFPPWLLIVITHYGRPTWVAVFLGQHPEKYLTAAVVTASDPVVRPDGFLSGIRMPSDVAGNRPGRRLPRLPGQRHR
jgi:hypothetical protein